MRGAGTLLYGSTALGGVINIIDERVPSHRPGEKLEGEFNAILGSVAVEKSAALTLRGGAGHFAWHLDGSYRETGDYDIPGPAVAGDPDSPSGTLPNSALENQMLTAGASWVGEQGYVGVAVRGFDSLYGIPAELEGALADPNLPDAGDEAVRIDLQQRRVDVRGGFSHAYGTFDGVKFSLGGADYEHRELEGDEVGTLFDNDFLEGRVELPHSQGETFNGVIGGQFARRELAVTGEEAYLPENRTSAAALFALQEFVRGPLGVELGLRLEDSSLEALGQTSRDFTGISASGGVLWDINGQFTLGASISHTERAPSAEELYADGPHLATLSFEIGDPDLNEESALGADLSLRRREGRLTGAVNLFIIDYDDYIYAAPTGGEQDGLPVFQTRQGDAEFRGAELALSVELVQNIRHDFHLELMLDLVEAELASSGEPLPFIPPLRAGARLHYRGEHWHASAGLMHYDQQDEVAAFETPTDGYTLVDAKVGYRFAPVGRTIHEVTLRGANLGDTLARNHVSRLKDQVPLPGRDLSAVYRLVF